MNLTKSEVEAKVRERVAGFSYEERQIPARFLELWGLRGLLTPVLLCDNVPERFDN